MNLFSNMTINPGVKTRRLISVSGQYVLCDAPQEGKIAITHTLIHTY